MLIDLPSKILTENITKIKSAGEKEYLEDSSNLLDFIKNELLICIGKCKEDKVILNSGTYVIEGFPWNSKLNIKTHLTSLIKQESDFIKIAFGDSMVCNNSEKIDSNILIAEAAFGSYYRDLVNLKVQDDLTNALINKIDSRRQSALKIVNSQSFTKKQDSKYCQMLMGLVIKEINMSSINHNKERVAGWQTTWLTEEPDILEKPFEIVKQLSSTRGRLHVLRNWDKIIRHPNFLIQSVLKDSYGINFTKNRMDQSNIFN